MYLCCLFIILHHFPLFSLVGIGNSSKSNFNDLKIAFVNSDTVAENYHFSKKLKTELFKKQANAESKVKKKYAQYQKLVAEYQQAAEIMGQNEAAEKAQTIAMLEQEIMQLKEH